MMRDHLLAAHHSRTTMPPDDLLLCEPETNHATLSQLVADAFVPSPDFVAIIGYGSGRSARGTDDFISLHLICDMLRNFRGPTHVLDPHPFELATQLSDTLRISSVVGIPLYWNVFAGVVAALARRPACHFNNVYEQIREELTSSEA